MLRRVTNLPFILTNHKGSVAEAVDGVGGICILATANAALLGGDSVFIQNASEVDKSVTATDYDSQAGIVLSGANVWAGGECYAPDDTELIGVTVADAGDDVLVMIKGICYGIAEAAITAPAELAPSAAVAGRLVTDATPTADEIVARAWGDAAGAASAVLVLVGFN